MTEPKYIISTTQIVISRTNQPPVFIKNSDKRFAKVIQLLKDKDWEGLEVALTGSLKNKILKYGNGQIRINDADEVFIGTDEKPIPKVIGQKIVAFYKEGLPIDPIVSFWLNLRENPSSSSQSQLFNFLERNQIPITENGTFIAYKKVSVHNGKLVDSHTRTIDNSVGKTVSMPRSEVDDNPENTCSHGLHVAGWDYAQGFSGSVLLEVEVNPKNVVAVPPDYGNQKMRVCEYTVVNTCEEKIDEILRNSKAEFEKKEAIANAEKAANEAAKEKVDKTVANFSAMSPAEIAAFIKETTGRDIEGEALKRAVYEKGLV